MAAPGMLGDGRYHQPHLITNRLEIDGVKDTAFFYNILMTDFQGADASEPRDVSSLLHDDPFNKSDLGILLRLTLQGHSCAGAQHVSMNARVAMQGHIWPQGNLWPTAYGDCRSVLCNAFRRLALSVLHICGCLTLTGRRICPEWDAWECMSTAVARFAVTRAASICIRVTPRRSLT